MLVVAYCSKGNIALPLTYGRLLLQADRVEVLLAADGVDVSEPGTAGFTPIETLCSPADDEDGARCARVIDALVAAGCAPLSTVCTRHLGRAPLLHHVVLSRARLAVAACLGRW